MKTFIYRSLIGVFFGGFLHVLIISLGILLSQAGTINADLFLKNALGVIICAWFFTVSPMYFEIKKWSLLQQTLLHFMTVSTLFFLLAFTIGWIPISMPIILKQMVIFIAIYLISWTIFFLYFKYQEKVLNEHLKRL